MDDQKKAVEQNGVPEHRREEGHVTLPISDDGFKDFIKSMLGSPQSMSRRIRGSFEINFDDIIQVDKLLSQRISQQNKGFQIGFRSKMLFSDDSSQEFNSLESLVSHNEIKTVSVNALYLKWDYMVEFEDRKAPERQTVEVSIVTNGSDRPIIDDDIEVFIIGSTGVINIRIEHTARTWGADIENMLSAHFHTVVTPESGWIKRIRKHSGKISFSGFLLIIAGVIYGGYSASVSLKEKNVAAVDQIINDQGDNNIRETLNSLYMYIVNGQWPEHYYKIIIAIIVSIFAGLLLAAWIEKISNIKTMSYLLLTKYSVKEMKRNKGKNMARWISFALAVVTSVLGGIIGNFITYKYLIS